VIDERRGDDGTDPTAEVGGDRTPEPLPDEVSRAAVRGDPEAEAAVEEGWEQAKSMEGEAPTG
jgi:hypothetical protein